MTNKILDEFTISIVKNKYQIIEEHIKLVIHDKPRYMPEKLWQKMLKMCLRVESKQL